MSEALRREAVTASDRVRRLSVDPEVSEGTYTDACVAEEAAWAAYRDAAAPRRAAMATTAAPAAERERDGEREANGGGQGERGGGAARVAPAVRRGLVPGAVDVAPTPPPAADAEMAHSPAVVVAPAEERPRGVPLLRDAVLRDLVLNTQPAPVVPPPERIETMTQTDESHRTDTYEHHQDDRVAMSPAAPLTVREEPLARAATMQPAAAPAPRQAGPRSSEDTSALFGALCRAQVKFSAVEKKKTAKMEKGGRVLYEYKFANLADVSRAVMPALTEEGIFPMQIPMGDRVYVRLVHGVSGQWIEGGLPLVLPDYGANDTQRMGSAITYTRRYLLCMMLGIVTLDEDDDGASAPPHNGRARAT